MDVKMNKINFCLLLLCFVKEYDAEIKIDIEVAKNASDVRVNYSGYDLNVISDEEIELFGISDKILREAVRKHLDAKPSSFYLKSPTPWGDLYKTYNWEPVTRVTRIQSANLKESDLKTLAVLEHDFENPSSIPIKVNAGLSQEVENTVATSWSNEKETTVSQAIEYDLNVIFARLSGSTEFSYTSTWGKTEERSETVTIGTSSGVEVELQPGQAVTAVLTASKRTVSIEVEYIVTLRGTVAVNFRRKVDNHHFYFPSIESLLKTAGLATEMRVVEIIELGIYTDSSLKVYDKVTKMPL